MSKLVFLGTGTSSGVPTVGCLTDDKQGCICCRSTLCQVTRVVGGVNKNVRRNTSAILKLPHGKTIMIDCGKTFYSGALELWPRNKLRQIDALLLTHPHADAILGLDDLRGWTLHRNIQETIHIYANQDTYDEIARASPYLTDANKATGGGDVPQFTWHVFDDSKPFDVLGVQIVPLRVHHGRFFSSPPQPFPCLGFMIDRQLVYLSDVSYIPEDVWSKIEGVPTLTTLVIDALRIDFHLSHFGMPQAIEAARRLGTRNNYVVGLAHRTTHDAWVESLRFFASQPATISREQTETSPWTPDPENPSLYVPKSSRLYQGANPWETYTGTTNTYTEDPVALSKTLVKAVNLWETGNPSVSLGGILVLPAYDGQEVVL